MSHSPSPSAPEPFLALRAKPPSQLSQAANGSRGAGEGPRDIGVRAPAVLAPPPTRVLVSHCRSCFLCDGAGVRKCPLLRGEGKEGVPAPDFEARSGYVWTARTRGVQARLPLRWGGGIPLLSRLDATLGLLLRLPSGDLQACLGWGAAEAPPLLPAAVRVRDTGCWASSPVTDGGFCSCPPPQSGGSSGSPAGCCSLDVSLGRNGRLLRCKREALCTSAESRRRPEKHSGWWCRRLARLARANAVPAAYLASPAEQRHLVGLLRHTRRGNQLSF